MASLTKGVAVPQKGSTTHSTLITSRRKRTPRIAALTPIARGHSISPDKRLSSVGAMTCFSSEALTPIARPQHVCVCVCVCRERERERERERPRGKMSAQTKAVVSYETSPYIYRYICTYVRTYIHTYVHTYIHKYRGGRCRRRRRR